MVSRSTEQTREKFRDSPPPYRSPSTSSISDISSSNEDEDHEVDDLCPECVPKHIRRRLIICADGTWMVADGAIGSFNGNASNMARIWFMVKDGLVRGPDGHRWQQRREFVEGIGAVSDLIERSYTGLTGHGYESKIKEVYKLCCTDMCPSDEIFMFGFSRGAFVVRAVAGLLHHMRVLDVSAPDFDEKFDKAIALYRATQDKSKLRQHSVFQYLSQTRKSPCIKFIGLIDTVKALTDDNLNDIGATKSVHVIRHALALFEKRTIMSPERFDLDRGLPTSHSIQEAWFVGTHGNLGGSCAEDGLSLWPLQWLVSEARQQNLVFCFQRIASSNVTDPAALIFQRQGDIQKKITCKNGIEVTIADLSTVMSKIGFLPIIETGKGSFPSPKEFRPLFSEMNLIGQKTTGLTSAFIHPSVFYLDDTITQTVYRVNSHPDFKQIRAQRHFSISSSDQIFWATNEEIQPISQTSCPRILVCGQLHAGKSSLINRMLGFDATSVAHGGDPGEHDIEVPFSNENRAILLHDSQGYEAAKELNLENVMFFLEQRRAQPIFEKQVHCIWYCVSTDLPRIQKADKVFSKLDFGGVPIVLIFTKSENLRHTFERSALSQYNREHNSAFTIYQLAGLPDAERQDILSRARATLDSEKDKRMLEWERRFPHLFSDMIFASRPDDGVEASDVIAGLLTDLDTITQLMQVTRNSMTGIRVARIHARAQDNFIKSKWTLAIDAIIQICNQKAGLISCLKAWDNVKQQSSITSTIAKTLAGIFELEGFDPTTALPLMSAMLSPVSEGGNSAIREVFGALGAGVVYGSLPLALLGFPGWFAAAGIQWSHVIYSNLSFGNRIVLSCLRVALVIEPIFWFGASRIDERLIKAAALYQVKRDFELVAAGGTSLSAFETTTEMKPALSKLAEELRYRRRDA